MQVTNYLNPAFTTFIPSHTLKEKGSYMYSNNPGNFFSQILAYHHPVAQAWIQGNTRFPQISGIANFYQTPFSDVLIEVEVFNLPQNNINPTSFYAMHIHEKGDCTPPFNETGGHYNPTNVVHPQHAGDLPPLLSNQGYAWMSFYDTRFKIEDIIGKSIIIHSNRDDFTTQPAGDSGDKIACGEIRDVR